MGDIIGTGIGWPHFHQSVQFLKNTLQIAFAARGFIDHTYLKLISESVCCIPTAFRMWENLSHYIHVVDPLHCPRLLYTRWRSHHRVPLHPSRGHSHRLQIVRTSSYHRHSAAVVPDDFPFDFDMPAQHGFSGQYVNALQHKHRYAFFLLFPGPIKLTEITWIIRFTHSHAL